MSTYLLGKDNVATGTIAASSLSLPSTVRGATQEELATLIDIRKCIGCEAYTDPCTYCKFRPQCVIWEMCRKSEKKYRLEKEAKN